MSVFVPIPCYFDYYNCIIVWNQRVWFFQLCSCFSFARCFCVFWVLYGSIQILVFLFQFCEKCCWYFDRNCIEYIECLEEYGHFYNINSSNPWAQDIFPSVCLIFNFFHQGLIVFYSSSPRGLSLHGFGFPCPLGCLTWALKPIRQFHMKGACPAHADLGPGEGF